MDNAEQMKLKRMATDLAHKGMYRHCVGFVKDIHAADWEICSGVLVQIDNRLFVATAAHCIPAAPSGKVWLLPPRPRRALDGVLGIVNSGKYPGDRPDTGYLELDPSTALTYLQTKEPFPVERLKEMDVEGDYRLVILVGFPGEQVKPDQHQGMPGFRAKSLGFATSNYRQSEWPQHLPANAAPADPAIDMFFEWPNDAQYTIDIETGQSIPLPDPGGTSGGGLWDFSGTKGELWSTEVTRLVAIQSSTGPWPGHGNYIRAVHIIHWLRLVHQDFPALQPTLERLFPGVRP
jgi:hypothetical protein